jgi:hypothetical protein
VADWQQPFLGAAAPGDPGPLIEAAWAAAPPDVKTEAERIARQWITKRELFAIGDIHAELATRGLRFPEPRAIAHIPTMLRNEGLIEIHTVSRDTRASRNSGWQTIWRSKVYRPMPA